MRHGQMLNKMSFRQENWRKQDWLAMEQPWRGWGV